MDARRNQIKPRSSLRPLSGYLKLLLLLATIAWPLYLAVRPASSQGFSIMVDDEADITRFPEVSVGVSVWDDQGAFKENVAKDLFTIVENGKKLSPDEALIVGPESKNHPEAMNGVLVMFLVDLDAPYMVEGQNVLQTLISSFQFYGYERYDEGEVWTTRPGVPLKEPLEDFTSNPKRLLNRVKKMTPHPVAPNWSEIDARLLQMLDTQRLSPPQYRKKRAIILLTSRRNAKVNHLPPDKITRAGVPIYALTLASLNEADKAYLNALTQHKAEQYFEGALDEPRTKSLYRSIARKLKRRYLLTYRSTLLPDEGPHEVQLDVNVMGAQSVTFKLNFIPNNQTTVSKIAHAINWKILGAVILILGLFGWGLWSFFQFLVYKDKISV